MTRTYTHEEIEQWLAHFNPVHTDAHIERGAAIIRQLQATISRLTEPVTEGELDDVIAEFFMSNKTPVDAIIDAFNAFVDKRMGA